MRHLLVSAAVLAYAATGGAASLPTNPFHFAIFAIDGVELGQSAQVDRGDVGVNNESGQVMLRARARVAGNIAAGTVVMGRNARANGDLFCTTGPVGTPGCQALTLPLVDASLLPVVNVEPGAQDVKLGPRLASTLAAGKYRKVKIGTKSQLKLAAGTYTFQSLRIGKGAALLCQGACTIGVDQPVYIEQSGILSTTDPADASKVRINIEFGSPNRAAFFATQKSRVDATVYAPVGIIRLGTNGRFSGAFVAKSVELMQRARVVVDPQS